MRTNYVLTHVFHKKGRRERDRECKRTGVEKGCVGRWRWRWRSSESESQKEKAVNDTAPRQIQNQIIRTEKKKKER